MRGTCPRIDKINHAVSAGAVGVILTNSGTEGNTNATSFPFGSNVDVPVIFGSSMLGMSLLEALTAGDVTVRITTDVIAEERVDQNVLAETEYGSPAQTIMIGAHLDSVVEGPGIQDNTSGSSAALELALQLKKNGWDHPDVLKNKIRFAWWAAEEISLLGSTQYVANLSEEERAEIVMYLNMDMIGSPNFVRFVLDGDSSNSASEPLPQPGSAMAHIERTYLDYFEEVGLPVEQEPFSNSYMFTGKFHKAVRPSIGCCVSNCLRNKRLTWDFSFSNPKQTKITHPSTTLEFPSVICIPALISERPKSKRKSSAVKPVNRGILVTIRPATLSTMLTLSSWRKWPVRRPMLWPCMAAKGGPSSQIKGVGVLHC
jgi:Peptidase family M28